MSQTTLSADEVAQFLAHNPSFFLEHEYLLKHLQLPHPQTDKVLSLAERQTFYLRQQNQRLEKQLNEFLHHARENELISQALLNWACTLLKLKGPLKQRAALVTQALQSAYGLQEVQLRLWGWEHGFDLAPCDLALQQRIQSMSKPYTGPCSGQPAADWFTTPMASMALIPLYTAESTQCVGALALGSDYAKRFRYHLATDFLEAMAQLLMATLTAYDTPSAAQLA